jgi:predicted polyphosphate/ATP-dependent NAD kinase
MQEPLAKMLTKELGLIVNPIAGMGGSVGLKGTDGPSILAEAIKRGAHPVATERSIRTLHSLKRMISPIRVVTCKGEMGQKAAATAGIEFELLPLEVEQSTTANDTISAARLLAERRVGLLLFAGGDGTARDISQAVGAHLLALGIPCGVKNYSAVFARSPEAAGELAASFLNGEVGTVDCEVVDFDELGMREDRIVTRICGILRVPSSVRFMQSAKSITTAPDEQLEQGAIAKFVVEEMDPGFQYVLGPGSTTNMIADYLKSKKTLLGVDVFFKGKLLARDVTADELEALVQQSPTKLVLTPIGGQGFIFGRGNQQFSPGVIRKVGKQNIIIVCTRTKLANLPQRRFLVDTGERELDEELRGYWRIVAGYREFIVVKVES